VAVLSVPFPRDSQFDPVPPSIPLPLPDPFPDVEITPLGSDCCSEDERCVGLCVEGPFNTSVCAGDCRGFSAEPDPMPEDPDISPCPTGTTLRQIPGAPFCTCVDDRAALGIPLCGEEELFPEPEQPPSTPRPMPTNGCSCQACAGVGSNKKIKCQLNGKCGHLNTSEYFLKSGQRVTKGSRCVSSRRMNEGNARANAQAIKRLEGFDRMASKTDKLLAKLARKAKARQQKRPTKRRKR
jgi:hypothetical protein